MKTILLANGPINDYDSARRAMEGYSYIVACDGGLVHAQRLGVTPDCLIGDMDSVPPGLLSEYVEQGISPRLYPTDKDETDLALGMAHALSQNPSSIVMLGALGGRFDHSLANIHVLTQAMRRGIPAIMADERNCVRVTDGTCTLYRRDGFEQVTLIPLTTEVTGIITQGLKYPLNRETLRLGTTRGVSNVFQAEEAVITLENGVLLIITAKE